MAIKAIKRGKAVLDDRRISLFHGLSEPSRLSILHALGSGPLSVSDIVAETGLTQSNTSNHLACLLGCGLVVSERRGRYVFYRHADPRLPGLLRLAAQIASDPARPTQSCPHCGSGL